MWKIDHALADPYRYQFLPSWVKYALEGAQ
jgi:hypothetical protein